MTESNPSPHPRPGPANQLALERAYIAHERTMMAWIRTSVALITFGFSIQQFFRSRGVERTVDHLLGINDLLSMLLRS